MIGSDEITRLIGITKPFMLINSIIENNPGKKATGIIELTGEEFFFPCHYPLRPIMPGSLQIEAMSQVMTCCVKSGYEQDCGLTLIKSVKAEFYHELPPPRGLCALWKYRGLDGEFIGACVF